MISVRLIDWVIWVLTTNKLTIAHDVFVDEPTTIFHLESDPKSDQQFIDDGCLEAEKLAKLHGKQVQVEGQSSGGGVHEEHSKYEARNDPRYIDISSDFEDRTKKRRPKWDYNTLEHVWLEELS